jgi:hypothetical protein
VKVLAVVYFVRSMFGGSSAPPPPPTIAQTSQAPGAEAATKAPSLATLDPTLHPELMAGAESLLYTGTGRNIFSMSSAPPPKIEKVQGPVRMSAAEQAAQRPTGPPPPPKIDLTFFGFVTQNGVKKAFLLHGADVFIATPGQVVDHHYRIVKIEPLSIEVTDLLYNDTQTLPLSRS